MAYLDIADRKAYADKYYEDNRDFLLEEARKKYAADADLRKIKSEYRKNWWRKVSADWDRYKIYMVRRAKHRAKTLSIPFSLTPDDIHIPEKCPIFGIVLKVAEGRHDDNSPALDRIIPVKGYVKGNVMVISQRANVLKRDASLEELEMLVAGLRRITNQG